MLHGRGSSGVRVGIIAVREASENSLRVDVNWAVAARWEMKLGIVGDGARWNDVSCDGERWNNIGLGWGIGDHRQAGIGEVDDVVLG